MTQNNEREAVDILRQVAPLLGQFNCIASKSAMTVTYSKTKPALDRLEAFLDHLENTHDTN